MKPLFLLFFILVGCVTQDNNGFEGLDASERAAILERQKNRCTADGQGVIKDYENIYTDLFRSLVRGNYWTISLKEGSSSFKEIKIHVWKVAQPIVYYVITTKPTGAAATYQFVKYTVTENTNILTDTLNQICDVATYTTHSGSANSSLSLKIATTEASGVGSNYYKVNTTYNYPSEAPAFFSYGQFNMTKEEYTLAGDRTGVATITDTGTLAARQTGDPTNTTNPDPAYPTYSGYPAASTQFCVVDDGTAAGHAGIYPIPYALVCTSTPGAGPAGWAVPSTDL